MRFAALALALFAGCTYEVRYESTPPGARVFVNNELVGTTPMVHEMPLEGLTSYMLRFEKDGYYAETMVVKPVPTGRIVTTTTGGPPPGQAQQPPPLLPPGRTSYTNEELAGIAATSFQANLHAPRRTTRREETEWPDRLSARMRSHGGATAGRSATAGPVAPSYCAHCGQKLNRAARRCDGCGGSIGTR